MISGNGVNHSVGNENSSTSGGGSSLNVSGGSPSDSDALSGSAVAAAANVEDDRSNDSEVISLSLMDYFHPYLSNCSQEQLY